MNLSPKKLVWSAATRMRSFKRRVQRQGLALKRMLSAQATGPVSPRRGGQRLILLVWEFPPAVTGGVYRPLSFVRYAAASGWEVEVVCGPSPEVPAEAGVYLSGLLPTDVPVTRVAEDTDPDPWLLPRIDGGIMNALALFEAAAARIKPGEGGVILASGPRFSNFVAGYWLARHTGWKLVLDYRDEWTENPHGIIRCDQTNRKWEALCQKKADLVLFTTQSQLEHQVAKFPGLDSAKCEVVYNGWEPRDFGPIVDCPSQTSRSRDRLTLTFVGNLGPWWEIENFLSDAIDAITVRPELAKRLEIRFVGRINSKMSKVISGFTSQLSIVTTSELPKAAALREMLDADALLLPNPPRLERYIAGKIYEYVAADRPILVYGTGGEVQKVVDHLGVGVVVPQRNPPLLAEALLCTIQSVNKDVDKTQKWLTERTRESAARHLYKLLDKLISSTHSASLHPE